MVAYLSGVIVFILVIYLLNKYTNDNISIGTAVVLSLFSWIAVALAIALVAFMFLMLVVLWLIEDTPAIDWYDYLDNKFKGN